MSDKWVSIKKALPKVNTTILCYSPTFRYDMAMGELNSDGYFRRLGVSSTILPVTHWMYMPVPPAGGKQ